MSTKYLVVLDAGHAEKVAGKQSPCKTLREWDFNNKLQYEIQKRLESHGITVYLTNPNPAGIDEIGLTKRATLANTKWSNLGKPECIFVSLHANALGNGSEFNSARGPVTFTSKGCSSKSTKAAKIFQDKLVEVTKKLDSTSNLTRGVWTEDFTVLCKTNMPAVLLEYGFYTNKKDLALLKNNRADYVEATVKAICEYFGVTYKSTSSSSSSSTSSTTSTSCSLAVRVISNSLNVRKGASTSYDVVATVKKGEAYTIVEKSSNNWGLLKAYQKNRDGWISLGSSCVEIV